MPSYCIRDCRVERFIASSIAAPFGPATVELVWSSADKICLRSGSSNRVRMLPEPPFGLAGWFTLESNASRSEEHTSELQSFRHLVCRLLLVKIILVLLLKLVKAFLMVRCMLVFLPFMFICL